MQDIQPFVLQVNNYAIGAFIGYLMIIIFIGIYAARLLSAEMKAIIYVWNY